MGPQVDVMHVGKSSGQLWVGADLFHVKKLVRTLGHEDVSSVFTRGGASKKETKVEKIKVDNDEDSVDPELGSEETIMFRVIVTRLNCLCQDRTDITFVIMKLCSEMFRPDV